MLCVYNAAQQKRERCDFGLPILMNKSINMCVCSEAQAAAIRTSRGKKNYINYIIIAKKRA
jgi:hypothetical protein